MGWIRIDGGLTFHWKLIDLRTRLVEPLAEAYLQRLWLWCHDNAPDGVLLGLDPATAIETAMLWKGTAGVLTNALIESGFITRDESGALHVHDWDEHNGKHIKKAKADARRAKKNREAFKKKAKSASANGSRTKAKPSADESGNGTRRNETERDGVVEASTAGPAERAQEAWNRLMPATVPRWAKLTDTRRTKAQARADEVGGVDALLALVERASRSPLLRGDKGDWCIAPDWFLEPKNLLKISEGNYDDRPARRQVNPEAAVGRAVQLQPVKHPPCARQACPRPGSSTFLGSAIRGCPTDTAAWAAFVLTTAGREPDSSDGDVLRDWLKAELPEAACTS